MSTPSNLTQEQAQAYRLMGRTALEAIRCAKHPYYAIQRGYVMTEDEKRGGEVRPMPPLPYLKILCDLFLEYPIGVMMKSRQMMASWLFCWLILWTAKFKPGSLSILQGKRLDDVKAIGTKSLMGRLLFIHKHLPPFLKGSSELAASDITEDQGKPSALKHAGSTTLTTLVIPGGGVAIAAPQGPDVIRSKTATTVLMDELPHHPEGGEAWIAALPTVDGADQKYSHARLWGVGTPNGRDPLCYEMAPWDRWREWDELTGFTYEDGSPVEGLRVHMKEREYEGYKLPPICCVRLHYTAEYDPEAWARRRATRAAYPSEAAYEREHEISFRTVAGMPVYGPGHFTSLHLQKWKPNPMRPVYISMDLGYQGTSACLWQEKTVRVAGSVYRRHYLWYHKLWKGMFLTDVLVEIKARLASVGLDWRSAIWMADYNTLGSHQGGAGVTDFQIFASQEIYPRARKVAPGQVSQGINLVRQAMKLLPDGRPAMLVDPEGAPMVVDMFDGGYRYDEPPEGKGYVESPLKDGVYDHIADSVRYRFWADPDAALSTSSEVDVLPVDEPSQDRVAYVKRYLEKRAKRPVERDRTELGPTGGLGA